MEDEEESNNQIKDIKIILLGDTGVGKTTIINRYINNEFTEENLVTLGSSFATKEVKKNKINYRLKIWDTTGQEKYHSLTSLFVKGSNIVILVYSIDSFSSFENLNFWYNSIKEQLDGKNYILAIVGNKKDLINDIIVTEEQGKNYANDVKGVFRLISAKEEQESINKLFDELLDDISQINYESITNSYVIKKPKKIVKKVKKKSWC